MLSSVKRERVICSEHTVKGVRTMKIRISALRSGDQKPGTSSTRLDARKDHPREKATKGFLKQKRIICPLNIRKAPWSREAFELDPGMTGCQGTGRGERKPAEGALSP